MSLESFETGLPAETPKVRRTRRTRDEIGQEQRNALIAKEHELDSTSKTINIGKCFLTDLRVSSEVWEEIRGHLIDWLEQKAGEAQAKAARDGRKTIQIQDVV